jgi:Fe-S cluster biogenesis protein NfuA
MAETADSLVHQVVSQFDEIVKPDGGALVFLSADAETLRVRYSPGTNEECESCVMTPDALAAMMKDMLSSVAPSIREVEIDLEGAEDEH